jgi:DNA-binding transcriptional MerR regulator
MELVKTYSASQFAKKIGTTNASFQKWEAHFEELLPALDAQGKRFYRDEDIARWSRVASLIKEQKMSLEEVSLQLAKEEQFAKQQEKAIKKLKNIRTFLTNMAADL